MAAILKLAQTGNPSQRFFMASLFDVGESLGSPETWSQTDLGGGGGGCMAVLQAVEQCAPAYRP